MATMAFMMSVFLTLMVGVSVFCLVFLMVDMIFGHRISDSLTAWYDRKFRTE
jgi:hypothetical protein